MLSPSRTFHKPLELKLRAKMAVSHVMASLSAEAPKMLNCTVDIARDSTGVALRGADETADGLVEQRAA